MRVLDGMVMTLEGLGTWPLGQEEATSHRRRLPPLAQGQPWRVSCSRAGGRAEQGVVGEDRVCKCLAGGGWVGSSGSGESEGCGGGEGLRGRRECQWVAAGCSFAGWC